MKINRRQFIYLAGATGVSAAVFTVLKQKKSPIDLESEFPSTSKMPVIFVGHGSPMNALENNEFTQALNGLGQKLPTPRGILVISAHWMTNDVTKVTHMKNPKTIHDFYGFPISLYQVNYKAQGLPALAELVKSNNENHMKIKLDDTEWGLDHGAWSVLKHLYPLGNVPIVQLSIDMKKSAEFHYELGRQLEILRSRGILILGSGNIVHNLKEAKWDENSVPFEWAVKFDHWIKENLLNKNKEALVKDFMSIEGAKLSVPTMDHYFPFLYTLGAAGNYENVKFVYEGIQNASISMRCIQFDS